jgi:hypothetical protein
VNGCQADTRHYISPQWTARLGNAGNAVAANYPTSRNSTQQDSSQPCQQHTASPTVQVVMAGSSQSSGDSTPNRFFCSVSVYLFCTVWLMLLVFQVDAPGWTLCLSLSPFVWSTASAHSTPVSYLTYVTHLQHLPTMVAPSFQPCSAVSSLLAIQQPSAAEAARYRRLPCKRAFKCPPPPARPQKTDQSLTQAYSLPAASAHCGVLLPPALLCCQLTAGCPAVLCSGGGSKSYQGQCLLQIPNGID